MQSIEEQLLQGIEKVGIDRKNCSVYRVLDGEKEEFLGIATRMTGEGGYFLLHWWIQNKQTWITLYYYLMPKIKVCTIEIETRGSLLIHNAYYRSPDGTCEDITIRLVGKNASTPSK